MPLDAVVSERPGLTLIINAHWRLGRKPIPRALSQSMSDLLVTEVAVCDRLICEFSSGNRWLKGFYHDMSIAAGAHSFVGPHDLQGALNILDHGHVCTLGLGVDYMHSPVVANVYLQLRSVIRNRMNDQTCGLTRFNDDRHTTLWDILSVLSETRSQFRNRRVVCVA